MAMDLSNIQIKRIHTARGMRLRISAKGEVIVTCHPLTPRYLVNKFVSEHIKWIEEKTQLIIETKRALTEQPKQLLFRGKKLELRLQIAAKSNVTVQGEFFIVTAQSEDHELVRSLIEKWYKKIAKEYLSERTKLLCDLVDRDVVSVTIRSQRTRWGSCTSRNTISLNWRLIQAPDWVSDYVIYHELAHLTHMNHSERFWKLVEDYYRNYKKAEKWLKENHELLHF